MEWDGVNIKLLAKEKGITLKQLAAEIGVTRQSVGDWVKGQLPKGNHLVALCKIFETTPNAFFYIEKDVGIAVPSHRTKGVAKVTPERQKYALQHATEYSVFFKNIEAPRIVPVVRAKDRSEASARTVAQKLRDLVGASKKEPITLEETFQLMENLGIYVIIKRFPETIKAYAFYTKIHSYRAVFVDYNTNFLDLIFALLHEAIHALRDEEVVDPSYDKNEEDFCDLVASHVQFPDEYIKLALNTISGLKTSHQVNNLDPSFKLNISGADTNFKKEFKSIGEILFADDDVKSYIDTLRFVSPLFIVAIVAQLEGLSDRRLGELLGVDHILDAKAVRVELQLKTS